MTVSGGEGGEARREEIVVVALICVILLSFVCGGRRWEREIR